MTTHSDRTIAGRGIVAAVLAAAVNAGVVAAVRALAIAPEFEPIAYPPAVFLTVVGTIAATFVFAVVVRLSRNPSRTYVRVAAVALVVSLVPDLLLLQIEPTATVPGVLVLMVQHVLAAVVVVGVLVRGIGEAI